MKMPQKRWDQRPVPPQEAIDRLAQQVKIPAVVAALLLQRGITTHEEAVAFLNPSLGSLHDPLQMHGMQKAAERIVQAIQQGERIAIYGDYDVDGVTAVALLYRGLSQAGAQVTYYLPDRHREGYGVSQTGVAACLTRNIGVLITIDCGIKAVAPIERATAAGVDVIVCDHHEPGDRLPPALAILNPKQKHCTYPCKALSGCAIGYKLLQALVIQGVLREVTPYLDLVAVSIAADIVPMVGENRTLAFHGLAQLKRAPCSGFSALQEKLRQPVTAISDIVFGIAPRINAAGRMRHARHALQLLLTDDRETARTHADTLERQNHDRKALDAALLAEALAMIQEQGKRHTTVLFAPTWHKGILGIVASRCIAHHHRPTILLTQEGRSATGSARSVEGYDLYRAITACADLLTTYGGHHSAAGLTLPLHHVAAFQARFEEVVRATLPAAQRVPRQQIDLQIDLQQITPAFYRALQRIHPFGPANRRPIFLTEPVFVRHHTLHRAGCLVLYVQMKDQHTTWRAVGFGMAHLLPHVLTAPYLRIVYTIRQHTYRGTTRYELLLKDIKPLHTTSPERTSPRTPD